ncbi:MAG: hypothetical protein NTV31_17345, partial [Bacteroidia bacterium]|nr:hypothetical protein [Bacteroidia bacterium]
MRDVKSPENLSYRFLKDVEDQFIKPGDLYCQAIENANGVPFQLVFGRRTGEGYYLNVGEGIRKLLGISPEEFTEKRYYEMIDKIVPLSVDIPSEMSVMHEKFISGELRSYRAEVLIRMPGGEKKWIQDTSLPWIDEESGKVIGAYGILFDINDNKKTLGYLEKSKEQAEESDRLKDAFLHNVSHEIRTPLNAIIGFSTLLCDIESDPVRRQEYVDIIFQSSDHLLELINSIVEISKIEAETVKIRREVINLHSTLMRVY